MSQKKHHLASKLLAVMMSAAMAISVITPTAIFAAPADEAITINADAPEVAVEVAESDEALAENVNVDAEVTVLPELNQENLAGIMEERMAATKNDETVIPMLWQGLLEQKITVGDQTRTAKIYVPQNAPQGSTFVLMNVPAGYDTLTFMYGSGWVDVADEKGLCLFVLEPGEGGWGTAEEEMAYIQAGYNAERTGVYLMAAPCVYIVGYGEVGSDLQKIAMANPLSVAAATFVDANNIDAAYLAEMAEKSFDRPGREYGVMYKDVPVPVMLANSSEELVNYWKGVSKADEEVAATEQIKAWRQHQISEFTPEGMIAMTVSVNGIPGAASIANFLTGYYRYGGGPRSNLLARKVDYEALGVDVVRFTDSNGIEREYLAYVPAAVKQSGEAAPVVIAYHGAQTSMRNFFENTLYYRLADAANFIVVFPESTLIPVAPALTGGVTKAYRPLWQLENPEMIDTEEVYAEELLDNVIANYNVDESRVYCTGHSMGCMMTNFLGTSRVGDRFAACGATSGPLNGEASYDYTEAVPMFLTMAEYDMWSYDISNDASPVSAALNNWLIRNGLATEENVADVRKNPDYTDVQGRFNNSYWLNANKTPVVCYSWITAKDHVNIFEENKVLYGSWFAKWAKTENGLRTFNGVVQPVEHAYTELPELNQDNLAEIMEQRIAATKNDETVIPMLWQGMLEQKIKVGDQTRTAKIYVPKNTPQGSTFVLMNLPEGEEDTIAWMYNSGWVNIANEKGLCLFVLEPGEGGWGTAAEEMDYIQAGYSAERTGVYLMAAPCVYIVGYGEVGSDLQKVAMANPLSVAAAAFIDANEVEDAYLAEMAEKSFDRPGREYGVNYADVPVPVMLKGSSDKLTNYWRGVCKANDKYVVNESRTLWVQDEANDFTPEGRIVAVLEWNDELDTDSIAKFIGGYYRYGGGPRSNMISMKVNYDTDGGDVVRFTDSNGIDREYLAFVPKAVKESGNPAPLVVAYHGAQTSMRNFFENTLYYELANKYNFIVVFPESTLIPVAPALTGGITKAYRPLWQLENPEMIGTEETYADELLDNVIANYNIDESRIYCTGHSMGCMMTNFLGTSKVGDRFAACGATSGPLNGEAAYDYTETLPMFLTMAEYDMWSYDISNDASPVSAALNNWLVRNKLATEETANDVRKNPGETFVEGRYNNSVWFDENGIPVVRYAWVTAKDHVNIVDENVQIWEQWFMKWAKDEDGNRIYEGAVQPTKLTEDNVPEIDITRGMVLPMTGYLSQDIQVGDETRTVKLYIGEGAPVRTYMSIINVPDGVDTYKFLEKTGWIDLMNERHEGVFVLEPGEGGWGTAEEEQAYIAAAFAAYNTRKWYSNYSESYVIGYGQGGSALQQFVMSKPTAFIAATFVDASDIDEAFLTENAAAVNDAQTDILKGDIPVPVFLFGTNDAVVNYWKKANHVGEGREAAYGTVYEQAEDTLMTSYTKDVKSAVYVANHAVDATAAWFTKDMYEQMAKYTRYENNWANGNALMLRPDYEELGVEFFAFDQDGYNREYMVYKPASAPEKDIPVVYVMAGNTQTPRVFFDCTSWWQVADDYGFMIVLPCEQFNTAVDLTWNITGYQPGSATATADDVQFLKDIIAEVDAHYNTDPNRRYVTGQSYGSMWTNYCALHMSDYFTAFGSTSGPISFAIDGTEDTDIVPVWLFAGQYDIFDWDFTKDVTAGFSLKNTVEYYLDRDGLGSLEDYDKTVDGRFTTYTWSNEDDIPLYVFTQTAGRNHNCIPIEGRMIWEQWFSKWTKDDEGVRYYDGKAVTPKEEEDPIETFVAALYETCLGRVAKDEEIQSWASALKEGRATGSKVAHGFFFSQEYINAKKSNTEFVEDLYRVLLGREADASGLEAWVAALERGVSPQKVFAGFVNSPEFAATCREHGIDPGTYKSNNVTDLHKEVTAFVVRLYKITLNRNFDRKGLENWVTLLVEKKITGSKAARGFFNSQEFANRNLSDEEFVRTAYLTLLNREPDDAGFAAWVKALGEGASREKIVNGFVKSPEFAALCAQYGIDK